MKTQLMISVAVGLLVGSGGALAQNQTPRGYDSSGPPVSSNPEAHRQSTTPDRPAAAAMPDANKSSSGTTDQAPARSEKMEPGMDNVGRAKTAPGEEKR